MHSRPVARITGQLPDVCAGQKLTYGGSRDTDVTDWHALRAAVAGTVEQLGGIDVVIANAGIAPWGPIRIAVTDRGLAGLAVRSPIEPFATDVARRTGLEAEGGGSRLLDRAVAAVETFL